MSTNQQLVARLNGVAETVAKISTETKKTVELVTELKTKLEQGEVSPEVLAALSELETQVAAVDALVPDIENVAEPVVEEPAPATEETPVVDPAAVVEPTPEQPAEELPVTPEEPADVVEPNPALPVDGDEVTPA